MNNSNGNHRNPFDNGIRMIVMLVVGFEVIFIIAKMRGFAMAIFPIMGLLIIVVPGGVYLLGQWATKFIIAGIVDFSNRDSTGIVLGETSGWPSVSIFLEEDERECARLAQAMGNFPRSHPMVKALAEGLGLDPEWLPNPWY